jgi:hypothetical protein
MSNPLRRLSDFDAFSLMLSLLFPTIAIQNSGKRLQAKKMHVSVFLQRLSLAFAVVKHGPAQHHVPLLQPHLPGRSSDI